jgi:hypothetical protein
MPAFGTVTGSFAEGNDSRFDDMIDIGLIYAISRGYPLI